MKILFRWPFVGAVIGGATLEETHKVIHDPMEKYNGHRVRPSVPVVVGGVDESGR